MKLLYDSKKRTGFKAWLSMGMINKNIRSETGRLPLVLGKLLGGVMTVVGLAGIIIIYVRWPNPPRPDVLPYALAGMPGLVIFILCSRTIEKKMQENPDTVPDRKEKRMTSALSWAILLVLSICFLLFVFVMTRQ